MNNHDDDKFVSEKLLPAAAIGVAATRAAQTGNVLQVVRDAENIVKDGWKKGGAGVLGAIRRKTPAGPQRFGINVAENVLKKLDKKNPASRASYKSSSGPAPTGKGGFAKTIGAGAAFGLGNLAVDIIADKYFEEKKDKRRQELVNSSRKRNLGKANKALDDLDILSPYGKIASLNISSLMEKYAEAPVKGRYGKKLLVDGLARPAMRGIAFTLPTAAVSKGLQKDLNFNFAPLDKDDESISFDIDPETFKTKDLKNISKIISKEIRDEGRAIKEMKALEENPLNKVASKAKRMAKAIEPALDVAPWDQFFAVDLPTAALGGVATAGAISGASKLTNKNLRANLEPLDRSESNDFELTLRRKGNSSQSRDMNLIRGMK